MNDILKKGEAREVLKLSLDFFNKGEYDLSVYVLRDLEIVKENKDVCEMGWALYRDGYISESDAELFIEMVKELIE